MKEITCKSQTSKHQNLHPDKNRPQKRMYSLQNIVLLQSLLLVHELCHPKWDKMTMGEGVWEGHKKNDVIYEQPLTITMKIT